MSTDIHQQITDKIIAALEQTTPGSWAPPWHRTSAGLPTNIASGNRYHGINILALWLAGLQHGFASSTWGTYRQFAAKGLQVRGGEKGNIIVLFRDYIVPDENDPSVSVRRFVARASTVFNIEQTVGYVAPPPAAQHIPFPEHAEADALIVGCGIPVQHGGNTACYIPALDLVRMPPRERFVSAEAYYSTLLHELAHATGHSSRLDRDLTARFGADSYGMEELVAELGAAFSMAHLRLAVEPRQESVTYLASWLKILRQDKRAIFIAASAASKAADYLCGSASQPRSPLPGSRGPTAHPYGTSPQHACGTAC
jgi:antirestriction protein ArdC